MTVEALCAERAEERCNINWLAGSPGGFAELFKIGIGPSSSPAIGSMRVVDAFLDALRDEWPVTNRIKVTALGSLAWTAAAMAAGGLVSAPGGTNGQIENPDARSGHRNRAANQRRHVVPISRDVTRRPCRQCPQSSRNACLIPKRP